MRVRTRVEDKTSVDAPDRRRRHFLREGPNAVVLRVEVRLLSSGRARVGRRRRDGSRSPLS
ncbi:hypothetical protein Taro_028593 [Colocasia esculenta]|uniref:Uncharacterized protein n=1 Tax=Colocasia esculenta TaxID=4460 RepID=A0A843VUM7_COLES|nr:hypothetical protein [Colocasia esculenta]